MGTSRCIQAAAWTRRDFVRAGLVTAGAVALGVGLRRPAFTANPTFQPPRSRPQLAWALAWEFAGLRRGEERLELRASHSERARAARGNSRRSRLSRAQTSGSLGWGPQRKAVG